LLVDSFGFATSTASGLPPRFTFIVFFSESEMQRRLAAYRTEEGTAYWIANAETVRNKII
jgi:hypothetical protein